MNLIGTPISQAFGADRGMPLDRFYIERFLAEFSYEIHGDVCEIAERTYTAKFGVGVRRSAILRYGTAAVTHQEDVIYGDLTDLVSLPAHAFDAMIVTQTLNFVENPVLALRGIRHMLKPGGVALVTVAAISQLSSYDDARWGDYWRFMPKGYGKILREVFEEENIVEIVYGNLYCAQALLVGLAVEDVDAGKLINSDPSYPVIIAAMLRG